VPPDRTALDLVREVVPSHPYSCTEGECGSCEVRVLEGEIDHRDEVLSDEERAENGSMMICVSRARSAADRQSTFEAAGRSLTCFHPSAILYLESDSDDRGRSSA